MSDKLFHVDANERREFLFYCFSWIYRDAALFLSFTVFVTRLLLFILEVYFRKPRKATVANSFVFVIQKILL